MSVENTIKSLLAESRKLKETMEETDPVTEENVVTKNATAAEGQVKLDAKNSPSDGSGDNEDNKRNNVDNEKAAEGGTSKKENQATKGATSPDPMPKIKEGEELSFDMSDDVEALFNGEEGLTEEFRTKAETIFEAAVVSRIKTEVARLEEEYEQRLEEAMEQKFEELTDGLVEHVDGYLNLMVEQWMENNEVALESGLKNNILEGFVEGLKTLFKEHYIEVPEEKFDVVGQMEAKIEELTTKLDETVELNVKLHKQLGEHKKVDCIAEACNGLSDIEADKLRSLAEEISFEDAETYAGKLQTIRENYFNKKSDKKEVHTFLTEETVHEENEVPADMRKYVAAINSIIK